MWYDFYVCGDEVKLAQGQVEGNEPRIAILNAVHSVSDILDECTGSLEPSITITRVDDGVFAGEIDTHGLGDIHVRIARAD
jgi:hypothetical protein